MSENNLGNTQYFRAAHDLPMDVKDIIHQVYNAMEEKGYNPVNQFVGYIPEEQVRAQIESVK